MKVFDCTLYHDEDLILNLRFNILSNFVDKFVICESKFSHSGREKKLNFDINKFSKFKGKIIYHVVEDIPEEVENYKKGWSPNFFRENFHRNGIQNAIEKCNPDDLIIISDADEIPNLENLKKISINRFALFSQKNFLYKLNLLNEENWLGSGICYKKYLKSPQWLRNKRFLRRGFIRRIFFKTQIISNGGWHFSFLKSPEDIAKKIKAYSHGEHKDLHNIEYIKKSIEMKKFFIFPEKNLKQVNIENNLPDYIIKNKDKFKDWILTD